MVKNAKKSTTIKITDWLLDKLLHSVISDGYGMRGKSRWVEEAVLDLIEQDNFSEDVYWDNVSDNAPFEKTISLRFSLFCLDKLNEAKVHVRQDFPKVDGVKSCIIRTAILKRAVEGLSRSRREPNDN